MFKKSFLLYLFLSCIVFIACNNSQQLNQKIHPEDPFQNSIIESEVFELDNDSSQIIVGSQGILVQIQRGTFVHQNGKPVSGKIKFEMAEGLNLSDMLLSNLTTIDDKGQLLETGGMFYINAYQDGKELKINPKKPLYIEVPTSNYKTGMSVYQGKRDKNGNMTWFAPEAIINYLETVPFDELDFLPPGFGDLVEKGMPFRGHTKATKTLKDSLYYSILHYNPYELNIDQPDIPNELYYSNEHKVINGKYVPLDSVDESYIKEEDSLCYISPSNIKALKTEGFANTYIATKAFETRLQTIFKTCTFGLLEIYIDNIDKNLWEADELVAKKLTGTDWAPVFESYANEKLTKVSSKTISKIEIKAYYQAQISEINKALKKDRDKYLKSLKKKDEEFAKIEKKYKKLLQKRENFRMKKYGFKWTNTGWANIDKGTIPKERSLQKLEVTTKCQAQCDVTYTYIVFHELRSIYRLNSEDEKLFYVGNSQERSMEMPKGKMASIICIAYKDGQEYLGYKSYITQSVEKISIEIRQSSKSEIKKTLQFMEDFETENSIYKDLEYMKEYKKEKDRKKVLAKEKEFLDHLYELVRRCCDKPMHIPAPPEEGYSN